MISKTQPMHIQSDSNDITSMVIGFIAGIITLMNSTNTILVSVPGSLAVTFLFAIVSFIANKSANFLWKHWLEPTLKRKFKIK